MLQSTLSTAIKFALASVAIGAVLSVFDISAIEVVKEMGLTPEAIRGLISRAFEWALPHFILGAMETAIVSFVVGTVEPLGFFLTQFDDDSVLDGLPPPNQFFLSGSLDIQAAAAVPEPGTDVAGGMNTP